MKLIDFIEDFVAPIPGYIIGKLLGVPEEDRPHLRVWSENIVQFFEPQRTVEQIQMAEETTTEFADYLIKLAAQRRRNPEDDLISDLIASESEGKLNEDEFISTCMLILMAGHGCFIVLPWKIWNIKIRFLIKAQNLAYFMPRRIVIPHNSITRIVLT